MTGHLTTGHHRRKFWTLGLALAGITFLLPIAVSAQSASVDQLIKKLPPPEKVVKTDPASRDPLVQQILASVKAMNFGNAYALSQKLAAKYPKSAGAQSLHGQLALALRRYSEATNAFHKAIAIQPDFGFAYVGLALAEMGQGRFDSGMNDFRQVTHIWPNNEIGWIGLSSCSEKLGHKSDSLNYARRATAIAPSSYAAWRQLAREESVSGNPQAANKAMARANQLRQNAPKHLSTH